MLTIWLPLLSGLVLLVLGGEFLVRGAVRIAERLGVSPLVIGLTLVGFGTSTPELVTSVRAALADAPGIAYGNIVGSNIANVLLIGGVAALLAPISVGSAALKRDGGVMILAAVAFVALAASVPMTRAVGFAFVIALALYIYASFRMERNTTGREHGAAYEKAAALEAIDPMVVPDGPDGPGLWPSVATALGGLLLVVLGGGLLVDGAVALARSMAISETVIGLSIVAVGTSMPELVTSVVAAVRRQSDVAFGNIVGSNIYNLLGIGGITALIAPTEVPSQIVAFDNPVMLGVSCILIGFAFTGLSITRREGAALLAGYGVYLWWIWPA